MVRTLWAQLVRGETLDGDVWRIVSVAPAMMVVEDIKLAAKTTHTKLHDATSDMRVYGPFSSKPTGDAIASVIGGPMSPVASDETLTFTSEQRNYVIIRVPPVQVPPSSASAGALWRPSVHVRAKCYARDAAPTRRSLCFPLVQLTMMAKERSLVEASCDVERVAVMKPYGFRRPLLLHTALPIVRHGMQIRPCTLVASLRAKPAIYLHRTAAASSRGPRRFSTSSRTASSLRTTASARSTCRSTPKATA